MKEIIREQYLLVRLDEERAIAALPGLLGADGAQRKDMLEAVHQVIAATGALSVIGLEGKGTTAMPVTKTLRVDMPVPPKR